MKFLSIEDVFSERATDEKNGSEIRVESYNSKEFAILEDWADEVTDSGFKSGETAASTDGGAEADKKIPQNKRRGRTLSWVIASTAILLTLVFAYKFIFAPKASADSTPQTVSKTGGSIRLSPDQMTSITTETVRKRMVADEIKSPAKIAFNGNQQSPVLSQFSGRLVKLLAEVGQTVTKGQTIGWVETPDVVQPQSDYQQAVANERTTETSLLHLTRTRERAERLTKVEAIPLRELQQAQIDEKHAHEDLERSQQTIAAAKSRLLSLHFSEIEIKDLDSGHNVLKREVPLIAPISGTIVERKAGLGQIVQPGGDPLFQIANLSTVWVNAEVYEDQLSKLRVGLPASIAAPAYPSERFSARIDQIGNVVDPDKRTVAVRCILPNPSGKLKPGMFVNVSLGGVSNREEITVPPTAVVTEGEKSVVYIETSPGEYEKRDIVLGGESEGTVVIKSGLKDGDRVVIKGGLLIAAEGDNAKQ